LKYLSAVLFLTALAFPTCTEADDLARYYPADSLIYIGSTGVDDIKDAFDNSEAGRVWNLPRFDGIRGLIPKMPQLIAEMLEKRLAEAADSNEHLAEIEQMALSTSQETLSHLLGSLNHSIAFGIADIIIDPIEPEVICYLIIDAGDDSERYKGVFGKMLMELALEDPRVEDLDGVQWAVIDLGTQPSIEIWWAIHEQKAIFAFGKSSAHTYLTMSRGEKTPLTESKIYREGIQRCIGDSSVTSSVQIDIPAIVGLVLDVFQEFGGDPPAAADYFIDEISRVGALHLASGHVGDETTVFTAGSSFPYTGMIGGGPGLSTEDLSLAPASPIFLWAMSYDAPGIYRQLQTTLEAFLPEDRMWQIEQGKKTLGALIGTSIDDLVAAFGDHLLVFEESAARGIIPGLVVAVSGGDAELLENLMLRQFPLIQLMARSTGIALARRTHEIVFGDKRQTIHYLQTSGAGSPFSPAWTNMGGKLILALHPTVLEQMFHRLEGDEKGTFRIPSSANGAALSSDKAPFCYSMLDVGELLEWVWPSVVPGIQALVDENGLNLDSTAIPSAHLFEGWQIQSRAWIDEEGYRASTTAPFPIGAEGLGGLLLEVLTVAVETQRNAMAEMESRDPFAEEPAIDTGEDAPEEPKKAKPL